MGEPVRIDKIINAPGSDDAIALGCRCPVLDNAHGAGYRRVGETVQFVISERCTLHATPATVPA